jgi:3'-phosphoadenosine 5'-phosphosulfate sulfotransferase
MYFFVSNSMRKKIGRQIAREGYIKINQLKHHVRLKRVPKVRGHLTPGQKAKKQSKKT